MSILDQIRLNYNMIESSQVDELVSKYPKLVVYCRVKGQYGDRKNTLKMTIKRFNDGDFLRKGEFITQLWID